MTSSKLTRGCMNRSKKNASKCRQYPLSILVKSLENGRFSRLLTTIRMLFPPQFPSISESIVSFIKFKPVKNVPPFTTKTH